MDESTLPASRVCTKCGEDKPASEFYIQRYNKQRKGRRAEQPSLFPRCKDCHRASMRVPPFEPRNCEYCGAVYSPVRRDARWCSRQCFSTWKRREDGVQEFVPAIVNGMMACTQCGGRKSVDEFYPRKDRPDARVNCCKLCATAKTRAARRSDRGRNAYYLREYGVTLEWYEQTLSAQGDACALCQSPPREGKRLGVDHCHATGKVRALLCDTCNKGLGHFGDDPDLLRRAAAYVAAHAALDVA